MSVSRNIGIGMNAMLGDVQRLERRAEVAELQVIKLMNEKRDFYDARARVFATHFDARADYLPLPMCVHMEIRPTNHSFRFTDNMLSSSHAPMAQVAHYIDQLLDAHVRHLRPQLEEGAWKAARQAARDPRAHAYR